MTYDDWKAREPEGPEPLRCDICGHPDDYCDCFCCHPVMLECDKCGAQAGEIMVKSGYRGGPCECGGDVKELR